MAVDEDLTQRSDGALAITAEEAGGVSQSQNPAVLAGDFH